MKKLTALAIALTMLLSFAACSSEDSGTADAGVTTAKAETVKDETTTKKEETTAPETTTAEETTTEAAVKLSEKDALVKDIIAERAANIDNDPYRTYDDGRILLWTYTDGSGYYHSVVYDTEKKELRKLEDIIDGITQAWGLIYLNNSIYLICRKENVNGWLLHCDMNGNVLTKFEANDCDDYVFLSDGSIAYKKVKYDGWDVIYNEWCVIDKDWKECVELPKLTVDIGHGIEEERKVTSVDGFYKNKLYVTYDGGDSKAINLDTLEIMNLTEGEKLACDSYGRCTYYPLAGKYAIGGYNGRTICDFEAGKKIDYFVYYDNFWVTPEAFYYVANSRLYKYISEDESELIYDGSQNGSSFDLVGENYLVVRDYLGTFLIDIATGEETKLDL